MLQCCCCGVLLSAACYESKVLFHREVFLHVSGGQGRLALQNFEVNGWEACLVWGFWSFVFGNEHWSFT